MLDPNILRALQEYLGNSMGSILSPDQMTALNMAIQNAPKDPVIGLNGQGVINTATPMTSATPPATQSNASILATNQAAGGGVPNQAYVDGKAVDTTLTGAGGKYQGTMSQGKLIPPIVSSYQGEGTAGTSIAGGKVTLSPEQQAYLAQQNAGVAAKNAQAQGGAMAKGGVIREPVEGVGMKTGQPYELGENGPETVTPGAPPPGAPQPPPPGPIQQPMPTAGTMAPQPMGMLPPQAPPRPPVKLSGWAKNAPGVLKFVKDQPVPPAAGATGKAPPKGDPMARQIPT